MRKLSELLTSKGIVLNIINKLILVIIFTSFFMTGCSTVGNRSLQHESPELIVNQLRPGTTKAQVLHLLGAPNDINFTSDGLEVLKYEFQRHRPWVRNFTPIALFSIGSNIDLKQIVIVFNENKVIKKIATNSVVLHESFGIFE